MEKKKFNLVDVLIILFIIVALIGGAFVIKEFTAEKTEETKTIVFEVTERKEAFTEIIKPGEIAYDGVKNSKLGKVLSYEIKPTEKESISSIDGSLIMAKIPERYDILITIEVAKSHDVKVGEMLWIETPTYKFDGFVVEIDDKKAVDAE